MISHPNVNSAALNYFQEETKQASAHGAPAAAAAWMQQAAQTHLASEQGGLTGMLQHMMQNPHLINFPQRSLVIYIKITPPPTPTTMREERPHRSNKSEDHPRGQGFIQQAVVANASMGYPPQLWKQNILGPQAMGTSAVMAPQAQPARGMTLLLI
jgi:hypothetical protein